MDKKDVIEILKRNGVTDPEAVANEIENSARSHAISPWWNSRERYEHELAGVRPQPKKRSWLERLFVR